MLHHTISNDKFGGKFRSYGSKQRIANSMVTVTHVVVVNDQFRIKKVCHVGAVYFLDMISATLASWSIKM